MSKTFRVISDSLIAALTVGGAVHLVLAQDTEAAKRTRANTELMPFVERDIRVTGTVVEKNGLKTILLESIEAAK